MRAMFAVAGIALFSVMGLMAIYCLARPGTIDTPVHTIVECLGLFFVGLVNSFLALPRDN